MRLSRRRFLHLTAVLRRSSASRQGRWRRIIRRGRYASSSGFTPGGSTDIAARRWANGCPSGSAAHSSSRIDRCAGASIANRGGRARPPDGYTSAGQFVGYNHATLYQSSNFIRDIAPSREHDSAAPSHAGESVASGQTFRELIGYAKANPGKITMASPGNGSIGHMAGELLR